MKAVLKILLKLLGVALALFAVTFTVYMLNLDMKLTSLLEPFLVKHYDSMERNTHL